MSQSKAYQPLPSMSTEQPLVPPATYHYRREGWFGAVRIWNVSDQSGSTKEISPVTEHQETCNPFATSIQSIGGCWQADDEFDEDVNGLGAQNIYAKPPSHCIWRTGWSWYTLSERCEDQSEPGEDKRVMDFETEIKELWMTLTVFSTIAKQPTVRER
ncbi:hypothetical protein FRC00_000159 [Tulasnella sp. 408]|nr:hypothetical protein FRC00_000159 [Tulasnella sp. 408]